MVDTECPPLVYLAKKWVQYVEQQQLTGTSGRTEGRPWRSLARGRNRTAEDTGRRRDKHGKRGQYAYMWPEPHCVGDNRDNTRGRRFKHRSTVQTPVNAASRRRRVAGQADQSVSDRGGKLRYSCGSPRPLWEAIFLYQAGQDTPYSNCNCCCCLKACSGRGEGCTLFFCQLLLLP